jgi:hypothetical protein
MQQASAEDLTHYSIDRDATISSVVLSKDKKSVIITLTPLTGNSDYQLRLDGLRNHLETPISPGTRISLHPPSADGNGLQGQYYAGRDFREQLLGRIDPVIDFTWGDDEQVDPVVPLNDFSVRWTGVVTPPTAGKWTFTINSDDGVRLWIDGKQIIDQWVDQAPTDASGSIELKKARPLDIRLEYYQATSGKRIQLYWASDSTERTIIPSDNLSPKSVADKKKK